MELLDIVLIDGHQTRTQYFTPEQKQNLPDLYTTMKNIELDNWEHTKENLNRTRPQRLAEYNEELKKTKPKITVRAIFAIRI